MSVGILPALPSFSSGQGGPIGTRGLSLAEIFLAVLDNHQIYKNTVIAHYFLLILTVCL